MAESKMARRDFLKRSGAAVALAAAPSVNVLGANEKIVVGCIGTGGRGQYVMSMFRRFDDTTIECVCDVNLKIAEKGREAAGGEAKVVQDFRKLLEIKDIDAVIVAPNGHWHPLPAIYACQAGKDVYLEKPVSITPREGGAVVKAARNNNRVVQVGTQQRNIPHYQQAVEIIQSGQLGTVNMVETFNLENRPKEGLGFQPDSTPPPDLDWDLWLGPSPKVPYNVNRIRGHYFYWDYAGGWQSDWAVHHNDVVHWAMKVDGPLSCCATGGKYWIQDSTEMPDTLEAAYEYPGFMLIYRLRFSNGNLRRINGHNYGNIFYGTKGTLFLDRGGFDVVPEGDAMEPMHADGEEIVHPHVREFLDCVKSRKLPSADILTGHRSSVPGELANISYRVGRKIRWDVETERIIGDPEADALCLKPYRKPWSLPA